jgi:peptide/nickel transport system substrate-binding protein
VALGGCSTGGAGDAFRVAIAGRGSRDRLDPHVQPQFVDQLRSRALHDTLVGYSPAMTPVPRLAESWESDATGTRWRTRLRAARFHDGRPVTADDVLYSFRRMADPATKATAARLYHGVDVGASRALGPSEVEVVLTAPNLLFPLSWRVPELHRLPRPADRRAVRPRRLHPDEADRAVAA